MWKNKSTFFTRLLKGRKKKWYPTGRKKKSKEVLNHASMSVAMPPHGDVRLCLEGLSSLRPPSSHHWQSGHHGEFGLYHVSPGSGAWMRALGQMGLWWQAPCGGHPLGGPTQGPSATNVEPECPSLCPWKLPAPQLPFPLLPLQHKKVYIYIYIFIIIIIFSISVCQIAVLNKFPHRLMLFSLLEWRSNNKYIYYSLNDINMH